MDEFFVLDLILRQDHPVSIWMKYQIFDLRSSFITADQKRDAAVLVGIKIERIRPITAVDVIGLRFGQGIIFDTQIAGFIGQKFDDAVFHSDDLILISQDKVICFFFVLLKGAER